MASSRGWVLLRDAVIVAAVALVVFQGLRKFVGDYYRVPTRSMEPFLHGDAQQGDVVFVDAWSSGADCRRGDVVVVRHPADPAGQLVKRIAARGDDKNHCWIELSGGDVWLGPDAQHLERDRKSPAAARGMRVPWAGWPAGTDGLAPLHLGGGDPGAARLVEPPLTLDQDDLRTMCRRRGGPRRRDGSPVPHGFIGTSDAVDATYIDVMGRRGREGEGVLVHDCGLDLRLSQTVDTLVAILETRVETFTFVWETSTGMVQLWRDGVDVGHARLLSIPKGEHRVEFGRLDAQLFFIVDGLPDSTFIVERKSEWKTSGGHLPRGPRTRLFVAALGKEQLALTSLAVFRDVYYFRDANPGVPGPTQRWPVLVEKGHWFLLGDNGCDTRDSRHFGEPSVPAANYLGRPRFVLGPYPRNRWLTP